MVLCPLLRLPYSTKALAQAYDTVLVSMNQRQFKDMIKTEATLCLPWKAKNKEGSIVGDLPSLRTHYLILLMVIYYFYTALVEF